MRRIKELLAWKKAHLYVIQEHRLWAHQLADAQAWLRSVTVEGSESQTACPTSTHGARTSARHCRNPADGSPSRDVRKVELN